MFNVSWSEFSAQFQLMMMMHPKSGILPTHHANGNYFILLFFYIVKARKKAPHFLVDSRIHEYSRCAFIQFISFQFNSIQFDWLLNIVFLSSSSLSSSSFLLLLISHHSWNQSVDSANLYVNLNNLSVMIELNYFILSKLKLEKVQIGTVYFGLVFYLLYRLPVSDFFFVVVGIWTILFLCAQAHTKEGILPNMLFYLNRTLFEFWSKDDKMSY